MHHQPPAPFGLKIYFPAIVFTDCISAPQSVMSHMQANIHSAHTHTVIHTPASTNIYTVMHGRTRFFSYPVSHLWTTCRQRGNYVIHNYCGLLTISEALLYPRTELRGSIIMLECRRKARLTEIINGTPCVSHYGEACMAGKCHANRTKSR